jgi:hypothetical protein
MSKRRVEDRLGPKLASRALGREEGGHCYTVLGTGGFLRSYPHKRLRVNRSSLVLRGLAAC